MKTLTAGQPTMVLKWRLRELMARHKLTNRKVAEELGMHETSIARMKAPDIMPKIDGKTLTKLCQILDCDISDLLEEVGEDY